MKTAGVDGDVTELVATRKYLVAMEAGERAHAAVSSWFRMTS